FSEWALAVNRQRGDRLGVAHVLQRAGLVDVDTGDIASARALLAECLSVQLAIGDVVYATMTFEGLAGVAAGRVRLAGDAAQAARRTMRLAGFARAHREAHNPPLTPGRLARLDRWLAPARQALGEADAAAA